MADETKKELNPHSFRISDDTYNQLKDLSAELSENQEEVLSQLLRVFKMEKGKSILPNRKKEIADFQNYTELLTKMFVHSLEDYALLEDKILLKYEDKIKSKENAIQQLHDQVDDLQKKVNTATATADELQSDNITLSQELDQAKKANASETKRLEHTIEDKDTLIQELKEGKAKANEQIAGLNMELSIARTQLGEIDNLKSTISSLEREQENTKKELTQATQLIKDMEKDREKLLASHTEELNTVKNQANQDLKNLESTYKAQTDLLKSSAESEKQRAILELERSHKNELEKLKSTHDASMEKLQKKYENLLEKLENIVGVTKK